MLKVGIVGWDDPAKGARLAASGEHPACAPKCAHFPQRPGGVASEQQIFRAVRAAGGARRLPA